jgi:phosphonate transport system substrate-binding protein
MDIGREFPASGDGAVFAAAETGRPVVRMGVISRYPPTVIYRGYQPIMDYLSASTPYRFELQLSDDYNDALQQLIAGKVAAVFLGSYLYVKAHARYGVIPILMPVNENGQPLSRSVLFVASRSSIREIKDLAGRSLALPSAESFSGNWLGREFLARHGLHAADLRSVRHFSHHHTVIAQVLRGNYDAGVTREHLVKDLLNDGLRVILTSDPIPSSPIAVAPGCDPQVVAAIRTALLSVTAAAGRRPEITHDWDSEFIYGFVPASDNDYAIIRTVMAEWADSSAAGVREVRP